MVDKGSAEINELLDALEQQGYQVTKVGVRYRVTNPAGGQPVFMPHRLPKGAKLGPVVAGLHAIGFSLAKAQEAAEEARQARLAADRTAGERALKEAQQTALRRADVASPFEIAKAVKAARPPVAPKGLPVPAPKVPRSEVLEINPTFAKELLTANRFYDEGVNHAGRCNRKFRIQHAQDYADAMLRGEWVIAESLKFDVNDDLVDGQHRLFAVVLAGETKPDITIPFMVAYDMPLESTTHYDTGLKRTTPDQLQMRGETNTLHLSAALRLVHLYDLLDPSDGSEPVAFAPEAWRRGNFTTQQATVLLDAEPGIRDAIAEASPLRELLPVSSAAAGLHLINRHWPAEQGLDFVKKLQLGANLSEKDPIYALRETYQWMRRKQNGRQALRTIAGQHLALWIMGWNLHVKGKERTLKFTWLADGSESFPILIRPSDLRRR